MMGRLNRIIDQADIEANRVRRTERLNLYRARGLDFIGHREWLLKWAGPLTGERILELGCGRGYMTLVMAAAGYRFIAADRDREMLSNTVLNLAGDGLLHGVDLMLADASRTPFCAVAFDSVIAVDFFHHVESPAGVLDEIDRVLKRGGRAILSDFNDPGLDLIASVHAAEGRSHPVPGPGRDTVHCAFDERGYAIKEAGHKFHWSMIACKS